MKTQNRSLTKQELKAAKSLDWIPTHYRVDRENHVCLENKDRYIWVINGELDSVGMGLHMKLSENVSPMPFDIESHVFSDSIADIKATNNAGVTIVIHVFDKWIDINKQDVIAMSKALGITAEDLK